MPAVVAMVHELAGFEGEPQACRLTDEDLRAALFAEQPALFGHVAVDPDTDAAVGFVLWFRNYSTWEGRHGVYVEDLYVRPAARGSGAGRDLLATLARICLDRGYPRLEWWVLDADQLAGSRAFYRRIGGVELREWVPWRVAGASLQELAGGAEAADVAAV
ncbi:MAG: N-acetyltransferase family protein [Micromonosporaceae bacterium]